MPSGCSPVTAYGAVIHSQQIEIVHGLSLNLKMLRVFSIKNALHQLNQNALAELLHLPRRSIKAVIDSSDGAGQEFVQIMEPADDRWFVRLDRKSVV